jgi:hypothetical protein
MKTANIKKRRAQRTRAKAKNPISAVKSRPKEDPRRVVLEARQRVLGVSPEDAAQPEAGTVLGRLKLAGTIRESEYEAGKRYLELYQAYLKALRAPTGLVVAGKSTSEPDVTEDYVEWATRAVAHYEVMKSALEDQVATYGRIVVEGACIDNIPVPNVNMLTLRIALEFLARKMGFENSQRAA